MIQGLGSVPGLLTDLLQIVAVGKVDVTGPGATHPRALCKTHHDQGAHVLGNAREHLHIEQLAINKSGVGLMEQSDIAS